MAEINQHFLPQYYLKTFAKDGNIFVFDKVKNAYLSDKRIPVNKIAFSKNFYNIDPEGLSKYLVNKVYDTKFVDNIIEQYNERISALLINSFIELGEKVYLNNEIKIVSLIRINDVIDFLVVQLFRTPFLRKQFEFIAKTIHEKYRDKKELIKRNPVEKLARTVHGLYIITAICNTEIWKNSGEKHLVKPEFRFIEYEVIDKFKQLRKLNKCLFVSGIDSYFKTSDNPIVLSQTKQGQITMLFFPITKRCSFTFSNVPGADKSVIIINEKRKKVLDEQNRIMIERATRFVYSYDK